jgi:hypothetical protein
MIVSVTRNLLLAVPPQLEELQLSNLAESSRPRELPRQVSAYGDRLVAPLDVTTQATRDELRALVEEHLAGGQSSSRDHSAADRGIARLMEVSDVIMRLSSRVRGRR